MIISYKHNFVYISVPKCASTSAVKAITQSRILDKKMDIWPGKNPGSIQHLKFSKQWQTPWGYKWSHKVSMASNPVLHPSMRYVSWDQLLKGGLVKETMDCFATVRNPIDRFLSTISYFLSRRGIDAKDSDYSRFWDTLDDVDNEDELIKSFNNRTYLIRSQTSYLSDNPTAFKIENFEPRIRELIQQFGGTVPSIQHANATIERPPTDQLLTKERQQQILDFYEDDLILWENAK